MRRLAAALLATTLLLAGCSGDGDEPESTPTPDGADTTSSDVPEASPEDVAALEAVTVQGDLGAAPTLEFEQPFTVSAPVARVETEGTGADLEEGQSLSIHYIAVSGDDGTSLGSTWDTGAPDTLTLGDETILAALNDVLSGQKVGVRVLFAAPGGEETESSAAFPATVMAIEVADARTLPTRAEGEAVAPAAGLPVVTLAENGEPSIEVPAGTAEPTELVVQPLLKGAGTTVEAGQTLTVQYSGWLFDGTPFDSSWTNGSPFSTTIGTGSVIPGWDQGLIGQTVGSQVLLVIPSELGYGEEGSGETIPPNSTLIFVVDILDAA